MRRANAELNKKKVALVAIIGIVTIVLVTLIAQFAFKKINGTTTEAVEAVSTNLGQEIEPIVVTEEVIVVAEDTSVDESLINKEDEKEEKEDETVSNGKLKVKVPKSTVASANSSEDSEKNKKTGGSAVSQAQAEAAFESLGTKSYGIDVSSHQGRINWSQVAASGVDFAIIRCGFRGQTKGGIFEDAYFKTNVAGAAAAGVKVGIYFYSTAVNENEALEEAAWVVRKISTYGITYPVVYDFEDFGAYRCSGVGGAQATSNALTFLNFVKSNGYEPMMYANKNDISTKMSRSSFGCKFWLAHYTGNLNSASNYQGSYNMWQYTSKGSVPGISGNVDMNLAFFSYGSSSAAKHSHSYTSLVKEEKATCVKTGTKIMRCSCGETNTETLPVTDHKFGSWVVTKAATTSAKGEQTRTCSVCGKTETKEIAKLPSTNTAKPNTNTNTNTNTNVSKPNNNTNTNKTNTNKTNTTNTNITNTNNTSNVNNTSATNTNIANTNVADNTNTAAPAKIDEPTNVTK